MKRHWPLLAIFFVAGMPALVYQVAWQRTLSLYFGVDIYSTSITVATFMLGLGLGSMVGGYLADRYRQPLRLYAVCEALLGVFGLLSLPAFRYVGEAMAGSELLLVAIGNFVLLLIPTVLMGMTLPLMCRSVQVSDTEIGRHFSSLYAVNTFGAAVGAFVSAYFLIGYLGLLGATQWAATTNLALAIAAILALRKIDANASAQAPDSREARTDNHPSAVRWSPLFVIVITCSLASGFIALGYQLAWYRLLTLLLHGTVYVFGTILFVFLTGIAFGSWYARRRADVGNPIARFGLAQLGISAYVLLFSAFLGFGNDLPGLRHMLGATSLTTFHPAPELFSGIYSIRSIYSLFDIVIWTIAFVGIPTFLMGYGFPQLMRAGTSTVSQLGRSVGKIYLANIIGSTLGSLVTGFVLLHFFGTENALQVFVILGGLTAVLAFVAGRERPDPDTRPARPFATIAASIVILAAVVVFPDGESIIRAVHYADYPAVDFTSAEDRTGVVALRTQHRIVTFSEEEQILGTQRLLIDGSTHGGFESGSEDVLFDSAVSLALSAHSAPRRVLSIGLGDGRMVAAAIVKDQVEELLVVELNESLGDILAMTPQGRSLFSSPKLDLRLNDGRRWLLANQNEMFDAVLMWPLHAAHANSGNLYSLEFFELVKRHLSPDGIVLARSVDMYSTARTIASVFDQVVRIDDATYVASDQPITFRTDRANLSPEEILQRIQADRESILRETTRAPINRDFRPNSEYYFTYPYASSLQTWGSNRTIYSDTGSARFERYVFR